MKQSINIARIYDFFFVFSVYSFIFITLLLFTVVNFQDKMEMDDQAAGKNMVLLGPTNICQSGKISARPNCVSENLSEFSKIQSEKIDQDKNQSSNKHQEVTLQSDHFSERRLSMLVEDINAVTISLNKAIQHQ